MTAHSVSEFEARVDGMLNEFKARILLEHASAVDAAMKTVTQVRSTPLVDCEQHGVIGGLRDLGELHFSEHRVKTATGGCGSNAAKSCWSSNEVARPIAAYPQSSTVQLSEMDHECSLDDSLDVACVPSAETVMDRWGGLVRNLLDDFYGFREVYCVADGWFRFVDDGPSRRSSIDDKTYQSKRHSGFRFGSLSALSNMKALAMCKLVVNWVDAKLVIHPNSAKKRCFWSFLCLLFCILDFAVVPVELAFQVFDYRIAGVMYTTTAVFWSLDMVMSCFIGFYLNGTLIMKVKDIVCAYASSWFLFDLILVICSWCSLFFLQETSDVSSVYVLRCLRLLRLLQLLRVARLQCMANELQFLYDSNLQAVFALVRLNVCLLCTLHLAGCSLFAMRNAIAVDEYLPRTEEGWFASYLTSMNEAFGYLLGSTLEIETGALSRGVSFAMRVFGVVSLAIYLSLTAQNLHFLEDNESTRCLRICANYVQRHRISAGLAVRMRKFTTSLYFHKMRERSINSEAELLDELPKALKFELCQEANGPLVCSCRVFEYFAFHFPGVVRSLLGESISEMSVKDHDDVFTPDVLAPYMMFVMSGQFKYILRRGHGGIYGNDWIDKIKRAINVDCGDSMCEAALWTSWHHTGSLTCEVMGTVLKMDPVKTQDCIRHSSKHAFSLAQCYARKFVYALNSKNKVYTDLTKFEFDLDDLESWNLEHLHHDHLIFLSHFKEEAGTEATLIQEALLKQIKEDRGSLCNTFANPVFLDSELLSDLSTLDQVVDRSHNLVVLLTPRVLQRPWCLVEMVLAHRFGRNVEFVEIKRPGLRFAYPNDHFYEQLRKGDLLHATDLNVLSAFNISLHDVEVALRHLFTKISLEYSPHKSSAFRDVEVRTLLQRCPLSEERRRKFAGK
eukprot:TRINITY_DN18103_c0_g1_i1.p1 TRINITY_DN18103_c0_g1~~TRINITY_DN18103_c0_g1_i1.p1  ORF type:complete len:900 (+),score=97.02 TRINITY_DN18103_c0_g1_i1:83-2782(+)